MPDAVGVPEIVIVFPAQIAVTPAGSPVATPIPVAPVVVWVMLVRAVLIHNVGVEEAAEAVLFAVTVIVFDAEADPQEPPVVVNARVAVPEYPAGGVHVALGSFTFGLKVPPASVDHIIPVALPPIEPPRAAVVPPWQIVAEGPALADGRGFTVTVPVALTVPQPPVNGIV